MDGAINAGEVRLAVHPPRSIIKEQSRSTTIDHGKRGGWWEGRFRGGARVVRRRHRLDNNRIMRQTNYSNSQYIVGNVPNEPLVFWFIFPMYCEFVVGLECIKFLIRLRFRGSRG